MVGEDYQKCKQDTTPLAKEDKLHVFDLAPPNLFSPDFARKSKEFMGQLKVQRSAIPPKWKKPTNVPFFGIPFSKKKVTDPGVQVQTATGVVEGATEGGIQSQTSRFGLAFGQSKFNSYIEHCIYTTVIIAVFGLFVIIVRSLGHNTI